MVQPVALLSLPVQFEWNSISTVDRPIMAKLLVYPFLIAWGFRRHIQSAKTDHKARMRRLIWVFADCICLIAGFVVRWLIYIYYSWNKYCMVAMERLTVLHITKICLFKYTENFTTKKWFFFFSEKKNVIFFLFLSKHRLWVLFRAASPRRF